MASGRRIETTGELISIRSSAEGLLNQRLPKRCDDN
jgi:hypothetical protein